jgi:hypothetical protein
VARRGGCIVGDGLSVGFRKLGSVRFTGGEAIR